MNNNKFKIKDYFLHTNQAVPPVVVEKVGSAHTVSKDNFPVLNGVTCYAVEVWEACMRLPHWHPNASELGYVVSGTIEVIIWRSPGETAVFKLSAGMCWFIPQAALHSLNNIGKEKARLLVGFSSDEPKDIDLPVAYNGIPVPIRSALTQPHSELRKWQGVTSNPLFGRYDMVSAVHDVKTGSPYLFDFAKVTPLFNDAEKGSVVWGIKDNWHILENISLLRAHLKPGMARDTIWYPDVGTLYVVTQGKGVFHIIMADHIPEPINVESTDYIFVPVGVLHTFINNTDKDFEVAAFFTKADPQPEVSLSVSTNFFPKVVVNAALTSFGDEHKSGEPLKDLKNHATSPYILKIPQE